MSNFTAKLVMYQSLETTNTLWHLSVMRGDKQSKCAFPQGYPHGSPESHAENWIVIKRARQTHRYDVLTLHGYCRTEGEEKLKEFIREREKRKTILIRQQKTPI